MPTWAVVMTTLLALFGGYCLVSFILARRPTLVHTRRKRAFTARHISHRGGAGECLENTMAAFRHASTVGTDMFELDCHLTRDGEVVVSHDSSLERLTGVRSRIGEVDYQELPRLLSQMEVQFDPGAHCPPAEDNDILRLADLFAAFPTTPMNIDVKIEDDELIQKIADLVDQYDRAGLTVWGSRFHRVAVKLYTVNPNVPLFCSFRAILKIVFLYWIGLLPFVPIRESYFEIPMCSIFGQPKFSTWFGSSWKSRLLILICDFISMRPGLIEQLDRRGIVTFLWVLNSDEEFERAFSYGCEGVMTDYPTRLRAFLDKRCDGILAKEK